MSEYNESATVTDEARDKTRDVADTADRVADRAGDKAREAGNDAERVAERAKDDVKSVGHKVSDAIEDVIPGDSDRDGH